MCEPDSWQEHTIALCLAHKPLRIWQAIGDIALECGFNSHSHLGKYFRAMTGITPKTYRQGCINRAKFFN